MAAKAADRYCVEIAVAVGMMRSVTSNHREGVRVRHSKIRAHLEKVGPTSFCTQNVMSHYHIVAGQPRDRRLYNMQQREIL